MLKPNRDLISPFVLPSHHDATDPRRAVQAPEKFHEMRLDAAPPDDQDFRYLRNALPENVKVIPRTCKVALTFYWDGEGRIIRNASIRGSVVRTNGVPANNPIGVSQFKPELCLFDKFVRNLPSVLIQNVVNWSFDITCPIHRTMNFNDLVHLATYVVSYVLNADAYKRQGILKESVVVEGDKAHALVASLPSPQFNLI